MTLESPRSDARAARTTAAIVALHLVPGPRSRSEMRAVERVTALENRGLEGDRHAKSGSNRQVLLVESEVLEALGLKPGVIREQITVRGLPLNDLPDGTRLRAGTALLEIGQECDPCERMEEIRPGLRETLEGQRGRFVRIVRGGELAVGDPIMIET